MKTLLTLLCTAAAASAYGQTASTFAQRYEAIYGRPLYEPAPAPVVVLGRSGRTLITSAGPIVLLNTGISSGPSFDSDTGLRPFPIK